MTECPNFRTVSLKSKIKIFLWLVENDEFLHCWSYWNNTYMI